MKTIYKYDLDLGHINRVQIPKGAEILCVQSQKQASKEVPCLWAIVDTDAPTTYRRFFIFGTGEAMNPEYPLTYIGTFQLKAGALVYHVFEEKF